MVEKKELTKEQISSEINDYFSQEIKKIESQKDRLWYSIADGFSSDMNQISEIIPKHLYLTNYEQAENEKKLDFLGITHIMNITSNFKPFEKKYTYYCVGNIMDSDGDAKILKPLFAKILDFIHDAIMNNKIVLVHCAAGISRSSTVVIGYLMSKWKLPLKNAFKICRDRRPGIWPNSGFLGMLIQIEKEMFGKNTLKRDTWNVEEC